jgi:hypothetical protein
MPQLDNSSVHVFWLTPMPGVAETHRVIVAMDIRHECMVVVLPDDSQVVISADRAVCLRGGRMLTLGQWQYALPSSGYEASEVPPELIPPETRPGAPGTYTLDGRRTFA